MTLFAGLLHQAAECGLAPKYTDNLINPFTAKHGASQHEANTALHRQMEQEQKMWKYRRLSINPGDFLK